MCPEIVIFPLRVYILGTFYLIKNSCPIRYLLSAKAYKYIHIVCSCLRIGGRLVNVTLISTSSTMNFPLVLQVVLALFVYSPIVVSAKFLWTRDIAACKPFSQAYALIFIHLISSFKSKTCSFSWMFRVQWPHSFLFACDPSSNPNCFQRCC